MKVVLISLDALFDQDLPLMRQQPFFGEFLAHASGCTHVRTVYPALTYPAHTTLVTGVDPRQHGIATTSPTTRSWRPPCAPGTGTGPR